jgi:hypothetical protein
MKKISTDAVLYFGSGGFAPQLAPAALKISTTPTPGLPPR